MLDTPALVSSAGRAGCDWIWDAREAMGRAKQGMVARQGAWLGRGSGVNFVQLFIFGRLFLAEFSSFLSRLFCLRSSISGFPLLNVVAVFTAT